MCVNLLYSFHPQQLLLNKLHPMIQVNPQGPSFSLWSLVRKTQGINELCRPSYKIISGSNVLRNVSVLYTTDQSCNPLTSIIHIIWYLMSNVKSYPFLQARSPSIVWELYDTQIIGLILTGWFTDGFWKQNFEGKRWPIYSHLFM